MRQVKREVLQAARHRIWVLILGESGTGKELVARAMHRLSTRARGPFVAINCGALTESLLDSELFGIDDRVASSVAARPGLLEQANGGTLFLDEVGDMPLAMQVKLLRVLQEGELVRVGSRRASTPIRVDVRIIAATNKDLEAEVAAGRFREDLYWRLARWTIECPPLGDRGADVLELAARFVAAELPGAELSADASRALSLHKWGRGNIRELQAVVERASVRASARVSGRRILLEDLDPHFSELAGRRGGERAASQAESLLALGGELGEASPDALRSRSGIPKTSLGRLLCQLVSGGKLAVNGRWKTRRYSVAPPPAAVPLAGLSARQEQAVAHVQRTGRITRAEYAALVDVSIRTATRDLAEMVEAGVLRADGAGNKAGYMLP
jgi:transcriptional regulator with GAF, ATPase, and Fis domain